MREIASRPPLSQLLVSELMPGPEVTSDDEIRDAIACGSRLNRAGSAAGSAACDRSELPVNHLAGTCRLASFASADACVDLQLRVLGVSNLRVADASVMPSPPSGNTHATCMMIGERAADFILAEHGEQRGRQQHRY